MGIIYRECYASCGRSAAPPLQTYIASIYKQQCIIHIPEACHCDGLASAPTADLRRKFQHHTDLRRRFQRSFQLICNPFSSLFGAKSLATPIPGMAINSSLLESIV